MDFFSKVFSWIPWVPENIFFLSILMVRLNEARSAYRKNNLWSQQLRVSFPCKFRIIYLIKPVWSWCACLFSLTLIAEIWSYVTICNAWKKNCAKANVERKVLLKIVTNSFPKKYTSSFEYMKRTEVSWGVHTLYVFRSQKDKENFRSATLVLLYEVKLNIARQNDYAKQNIILLHFLANKPRHELSGIRKKRKTFCTQGTIRENAELTPARQSIAGNHHIHSKYVLW